jgi:hypothetical protein
MKVLAFESEIMIKSVTGIYNNALTIVNKIYDNYKNLELGSLDMTGIRELIAGAEVFIKNKYADLVEAPTFAGIKMKKANFIDTLELPDFSPVVHAINEFHSYLAKRETKEMIHESDVLSCFLLNNDTIEINEDELQRRLDGHRVFATTDKEKKILDSLNELVTAYKNFDHILKTETSMGSGLLGLPAYLFPAKLDHAGNIIANRELYKRATSNQIY